MRRGHIEDMCIFSVHSLNLDPLKNPYAPKPKPEEAVLVAHAQPHVFGRKQMQTESQKALRSSKSRVGIITLKAEANILVDRDTGFNLHQQFHTLMQCLYYLSIIINKVHISTSTLTIFNFISTNIHNPLYTSPYGSP